MKKDILAIFSIVILIMVLLMGTNIQSVDEYYLTHIDDITPQSQTVFISINCETILDNYNKLDKKLRSEEYVPLDGIIMDQTEYVLRDGDTVFDILDRAVRHNRIQLEYQGADLNSFGSVYIQGINYLYEYSCGNGSGWTYMVNGTYPNYGSSQYKLKDGDVIQWVYTCDYGNDIGYAVNGNRGDSK